MDWQEFFKPFALYGVLVSWLFGIWLTKRTKHLDAKTTSELATTTKKDYYIFALGISLGGVLLAMCTYGYMRYELSIPDLYYYLYGFVLTLQFITAWVPDVKGWKHHAHYYAAWVLSYMLLCLGALLIVDGPFNLYDHEYQVTRELQFIGLMMLTIMAVVGTYAGRPNATNRQFLRSQQAYIILFQLLLLLRIYS